MNGGLCASKEIPSFYYCWSESMEQYLSIGNTTSVLWRSPFFAHQESLPPAGWTPSSPQYITSTKGKGSKHATRRGTKENRIRKEISTPQPYGKHCWRSVSFMLLGQLYRSNISCIVASLLVSLKATAGTLLGGLFRLCGRTCIATFFGFSWRCCVTCWLSLRGSP